MDLYAITVIILRFFIDSWTIVLLQQFSSLHSKLYHFAEVYYAEMADTTLLELKQKCSRPHRNTSTSNSAPLVVRRNIRALQKFLPRNFSSRYRNPCWYSSLVISNELSKHFNSIPSVRKPIYTPEKARKIVEYVTRKSAHLPPQRNLFCLPSVYLAGFPKCGTTALYRILVQNPLVAQPYQKEGHFWSTFTRDGAYVDKQIHGLWYLNHFTPAAKHILKSPRSITLDASPSTLWGVAQGTEKDEDLCAVPSMIASLVPETKFIVIMRNPVKRLFSGFWFFCSNHKWTQKQKIVVPMYYLKHGQEIFHNLTARTIHQFHSCIDAGITKFECVRRATAGHNITTDCFPLRLGLGMYYYHIVRWMSVVPRERFLFLRTEDLASDPYPVMQKVWAFLGLGTQTREEMESILLHSNEWNTNAWIKSEPYREKFAMLPKTEELLNTFYRPHNERLAQLLSDSKYLWYK